MRSQIEGLASMLGGNYLNFNINIKSIFKNFPVQLIPANEYAYLNINEIDIKEKTILISCGKKCVKASILLKRKFKNLIFSIHIQDPKTKHDSFDLIISPEHDNLVKPNSISTLLALHNIKYDKSLRKEDTVNFIIGGSNKYFDFKSTTQKNILNEIFNLSNNYKVNVIPSRRTPSSFIKELELISSTNIKLYKDIFNPLKYGDLLSEAKFQIVTWDSISMISEAICSTANTFIYPFEDNNCPARYKIFYSSIIEKSLAKFYNQNLTTFYLPLADYNKDLKSKILNKIESHLWFNINES